MPKAVRYHDAPQSKAIDVAFSIAKRILSGKGVPTVEHLRSRYHMSRATSFRWRRWALDKEQQIKASAAVYDKD